MNFTEEFAKLNEWHKKLKIMHLAYIVVCLGAIATIFLNSIITLVLISLCVILQLTVLRPQVKKYSAAFNHINLLYADGADFESPAHDKAKGLPQSLLNEAELIPTGSESSFISKELFCGRWGGMDVKGCDFACCHIFPRKDKNHNEFLSGAWLHITLPQDTGCNYRILSRNFMSSDGAAIYYRSHSDLKSALLEKEELRDRFMLVCGPHTPMPAATVLAKVKELADYTTGPIAISLHGNTLDVLIRSRFFSTKVSLRDSATEQRMGFKILPELSYITDLARTCYKTQHIFETPAQAVPQEEAAEEL